MSDSLLPYESQHARPPCPSLTPGVYSNSYPSSWWCHPTTSSSVVPFSSCFQSFLASGSFPMSQFMWPKYWSFRFSISPSNEYSGLISFRMDCVDHNKLWKIPKEMAMPDHHTCLLRNLYACQEATVRTRHRTTDWFQNRERSMSRLYVVTLLI